jgi:pimeloyl-ACP methyl ester carboxylesterase
MQTITSKDGTPIAIWRSGAGPALLLVHGTVADHSTTWRLSLPELARRFTVYAMDRRGRGGSGDAREYSLQREAEDVAAVVDSINDPVNLLGHSYGGLCALEASVLTSNLRRLVLYEGVPLRDSSVNSEAIERLQARLDAGDADGMLLAFLGEIAGASPEQIAKMRSDPDSWAVRVRNAPTVPRELRVEEHYVFSPPRFANMRTPTLLMVGGESPDRVRESADTVASSLPDGRVVVLPEQGHLAMYGDPDLFVREIVRFVAS